MTPEIKVGESIPLPRMGSWPETVHVFDEESPWALKAALAARRPLLVRGEPGCGKSQLARAAAHCLGRAFISSVVHAQSEGEDLLWYFDAVARLGEAQALGATGKKVPDVDKRLDPMDFLSPGPLWWAFDWNGAKEQDKRSLRSSPVYAAPEGWEPSMGCVVLIDEIDKAESDLPNSLLETLGNGAFQVPFLENAVGLREETPSPLVIITTNEERELPKAFVRRCLVLELALPSQSEKLEAFLVKRGAAHFGKRCALEVRQEAARQLVKDRADAEALGRVPPGQAEYLDLLRAVWSLAEDERARNNPPKYDSKQAQLDILVKIQKYALVK